MTGRTTRTTDLCSWVLLSGTGPKPQTIKGVSSGRALHRAGVHRHLVRRHWVRRKMWLVTPRV